LYFSDVAIMMRSVQRGKQGGQKSSTPSGEVRAHSDPSVMVWLYMRRAARLELALDDLVSSGSFLLWQTEYNPHIGQSSSKASENAPSKTSSPRKSCCSLARAFHRFTLISFWSPGSWKTALNKPIS